MKVPLKFVDFGEGVSGAGIFISTFEHGNTGHVEAAYLTRHGVVLCTTEGRQLCVRDGWRCAEALYDFDWTSPDDMKMSPKKLEERQRARDAVKEQDGESPPKPTGEGASEGAAATA